MADDYAGNSTTTGTIAPGGSVSGLLEVAGDVDWFKFTLTTGDAIAFNLNSTAFPQKFLTIYNSSGGNVASSSNGVLTFGVPVDTITAPGTPFQYYVEARGFTAGGSSATGAYTLSATSVPDDHGDSLATNSIIVVDGAAVSATREYQGDQDWFRFDVVGGIPLELKFQQLMAGTNTYTIYDQYGRTFANGSVSTTQSYSAFTPDSSGTFYLVLDGHPSATGTTTFSIKTAVDDLPDDFSTTAVFSVNGPTVHGRTDFDLDTDMFALTVTQAGVVRIESGPYLPYGLVLYDAQGNELDFDVVTSITEGDPLSGGITARFDAPGQYYVGIIGLTRPTDVEPIYSLSAYSVVDDIGDTIATAASMTVGGPRFNGAIQYNQDFDVIAFNAIAGQAIHISIDSPGFFHSSTLYDAAGNDMLVTTRPGPNNSTENDNVFFAATTGAYYLVVQGEQGAYSVGLTTIADDYTLVNRGALSVGGSATGVFEPAFGGSVWYGDNDYFAVNVTAGQTISFAMDAPFNWGMVLFGPSDSEILDRTFFESSRPVVHTFRNSGTYFLNVNGTDPFGSAAGAYTVRATAVTDDYANNDLTAGTATIGGPAVSGRIDYGNDADWFAITANAGDVISFRATYDSALISLGLTLVGHTSDSLLSSLNGSYTFRFEQAGTYYIEARGILWEQSGNYSLSVSHIADDFANTTNTTGALAIGGAAQHGVFEYGADADWFAVNLVAGEDYLFSVQSDNPGAPIGQNIELFDGTGAPVALFPGEQIGSRVFTAAASGTYFVSAFGGNPGAYNISATLVPPDPLDSITTGAPSNIDTVFGHKHRDGAQVINVYFAGVGEELGGLPANGWTPSDITRVMTLLESFEAYVNIDFRVTTTLPYADIAFLSYDDPSGFALFHRPEEFMPIPGVAFSTTGAAWTSSALAPGGYGAAIVLNGLGFALGLSLPHVEELSSRLMRGVETSSDLGAFNMNQGVNTIMSYNDGWVTSPYGQSASLNYGWQATPMALDIAALQAMYGANTTANAGATTYTLSDVNAAGTGWRSIWDTGGVDAIVYSGARDATIDLRPATLTYSEGGGGYVSYVNSIHGGYTIANGVVIENATGGAGADRLIGNSSANTLSGGAGNDVLNGGLGNDTLDGGDGADSADYADATSRVTVSLALIAQQNTLGAGLDTLVSIENLIGSAFNDGLTGNGAANLINGGAGADVMTGGAGDDTYIVDSNTDVIVELQNEGLDRVQASATYILSSYIENLALTGSANINGSGNFSDNVIEGNSGNNSLFGGTGNDTLIGNGGNDRMDGSTGADTMTGGTGDDIYIVDSLSDVVTEAFNAGLDRVDSSITYALAGNLENLVLTGTASINGSGNFANNTIIGNAGANSLFGGTGDDSLFGNDGNDRLDGATGNDAMKGGFGDDIYIVDSAGDVVTDEFNGGLDRVDASVSYALGSNVENLVLQGTGSINGSGNFLNNTIVGNAGNNSLFGGTGDDTLFGNDGNDRLDGATGNDIMKGGFGDDIYIVDSAGDVVTDEFNGGLDRVDASVSYTLGSNVENLVLQGTAALNGTGNFLNNTMIGNTGANSLYGGTGDDILFGNDGNDRLDGATGNDTMKGGLGDDIYIVDSAGDVTTEDVGQGTDRIDAYVSYTIGVNIENMVLQGVGSINGTGNFVNNTIIGNGGDNILSGLGGNDTLLGGAGNDQLDGGVGIDKLTGGAGADKFVFTTALSTTGVDQILDFNTAEDMIWLDDAVYTGITTGALNPSAFTTGSSATDALDRLVYDPTNGALYYDADGSGAGAAVQIATLSTGLALTATNFFGI